MKQFNYFLFFFVLGLFHTMQAQPKQNIDSLLSVHAKLEDSKERIDNLAHLYNAYLYSDPKSAKNFAEQEVKISQSIGYREGIGIGNYHLGVYYNNIDQIDSARFYYLHAKEQFNSINKVERILTVNHGLAILEYSIGNYDDAIAILESNIAINVEPQNDTIIGDKALNLAIAYDLLGNVYLYKGSHNLALQNILKSIRILDTLDHPIRKADALNHLGIVEFYLANYDNVIKYNKEALLVYKQYNDKYYESQVLNDIGNTFYYLDEYDSAIIYLKESNQLAKEMDSKDLAGTTLNNLGKVYKKLELYEKSMAYSNEALQLHESTGNKNKIVESLNDIGMVYNEMDQPNKAITYFNRAISLSEEIGVKENLIIGYYNRSLSYEKLNQLPKSLADYKAYKAMDDSIFTENKSRQIEELRTIYETEKKEKEIALQKTEIDLLEQKSKVSALQQSILVAGVIVCLVLIALIYFGMRQKLKRKQLEKEVVDQELAFKRKELTTHALHLANKNEILEDLKLQIEAIRHNGEEKVNYHKISNTIKSNLQDDKNWENFSKYFEEVHKDFNSQIKQKYPDVTSNELRLMALLKMNLSSKEIANILNISSEGIKKARYRLRKKLGISTDDSLQDLILSF